jgi:hypothetical protein
MGKKGILEREFFDAPKETNPEGLWVRAILLGQDLQASAGQMNDGVPEDHEREGFEKIGSFPGTTPC